MDFYMCWQVFYTYNICNFSFSIIIVNNIKVISDFVYKVILNGILNIWSNVLRFTSQIYSCPIICNDVV